MSKRPSLADLRNKFKQKAEGKKEFTGNSEVYPHWNIEQGGSAATVRILPDKNEDNENYFYIDKLEHKLDIDGKDRKIACLKMWGEKCPICELSAKYYKAQDKVQGKKYYFKRTSLMKALILKDPIDPSKNNGESAEGQVKTLQFTFQLMSVINAALASEEEEMALEELPWDMDAGYNFIIKKTSQGDHDNYTTSSFSKKQSAIPEEYREIAEEGMVDLRTLLPENPGVDKVQALLEAHLGNGEYSEDEDEEETVAPPVKTRRVADEDAAPAPKRKAPVVEAEEEEEEEVPVKKRRVVEAEEEEVAPVKKPRRPVVEADEEEEEVAPPKKATTRKVVEEADEDEDDDALMRRIRARKSKGE
jgi:hypothetical protein